MADDYKRLRVDRLLETADRLASRIVGRFPQASLGQVAVAVADVTRNAVETAERINRPNWWLRGGLIALAAVIVGVAVIIASFVEISSTRLMEYARLASGSAL